MVMSVAEDVFVEASAKHSTAPPARRRRAAAFSYSRARPSHSPTERVRRPQSTAGDAVRNGTGGDCSSSSGEMDACVNGGERFEYTFVDEVPSECLCGLCGEVSLRLPGRGS